MTHPHLEGWITASVAKAGSRAEENEDAAVTDANRVRFAIADGASEGWQSGGWARHLAAAYVDRPPGPAEFPAWFASTRSTWSPTAPQSAAWYAEVKAGQGSFSTLLGLEFRLANDPPGLVWKAMAVGDSCLFQFRREALEVAFPLTEAEAFGNRPALVPSASDRAAPEPDWLAGWADPGDLFLLATDAVARFILETGPAVGTHPVVRAAAAAVASRNPDPVLELLHALKPQLNDDATVVAVRIADRRRTR